MASISSSATPDPGTGRLVRQATPLFLALVVINIADIVFAVDSVPAIFAITTDTFVVYTANIMAILGLRALYFALAAMVHRFHYLKYALALVLVFIGGKIFWTHFVGKPHPALSLGVTLASSPRASSTRCGRRAARGRADRPGAGQARPAPSLLCLTAGFRGWRRRARAVLSLRLSQARRRSSMGLARRTVLIGLGLVGLNPVEAAGPRRPHRRPAVRF